MSWGLGVVVGCPKVVVRTRQRRESAKCKAKGAFPSRPFVTMKPQKTKTRAKVRQGAATPLLGPTASKTQP